ncbi:MAG: HAMP domain-containing protein [Nitrosopumilaceae archaeon]
MILKQDILNQLEEQSIQRGETIRLLFDNKIQQIINLSKKPIIQKSILELNKISDEQTLNSKLLEASVTFTIEIRNFQLTEGQTLGLEDFLIFGKNGRLFFSLNEPKELGEFVDETKITSANQQEIRLIQSRSDGQRQMVISIPLFSENDSLYIGSVIATTNTDMLDGILLDRFGLETTGEVYLVNEDRFMVSESIFIENAPFNQIVNTIPVSECFDNNKSYSGVYKDYRGIEILGISFCDKSRGIVLLTEIDEREALKPLYKFQENIFYIGILLMASSSIVTYFLSKRLSNPIKKLQVAANEISKGNFDVRTNLKTRDEIGKLSVVFDSMAKNLQESLIAINLREEIIKQQEDILLQFSENNETGCVCIVDIIESTMLTANLSDEKTKDFYEIFINYVADIVKKYKGIVVKNIGDSLLFYFPKINSIEKDYFKNVIECCLTIGDSHTEINKKMVKEGLPGIAYRTSITYGTISIAKISTSSVDDIFGSTVNRCSKINRFALPNGVIIGSDVYEKVKNLNDYKFKNMNATVGTASIYSVFLVARK